MKRGALGFLVTIVVVLTIGLLAQFTAAIGSGPVSMDAGSISLQLQQEDDEPTGEDRAGEDRAVEDRTVDDTATDDITLDDSAVEDTAADSNGDSAEGTVTETEREEVDVAADAATPAPRVNLAENLNGTLILIDLEGRPFYTFAGADEPADLVGVVPVEADDADRVGTGLEEAQLGTLMREDGIIQLTYAGRPLYHYPDEAQFSVEVGFAYVGPQGELVAVEIDEESTASQEIAVVVEPETAMTTVDVGEAESGVTDSSIEDSAAEDSAAEDSGNGVYIMPVAGVHLADMRQENNDAEDSGDGDNGNGNVVNVMPATGASAAQSLSPRYLSIPSIGVETEVTTVGYTVNTFPDGTTYMEWDVASHAAGWHNTSALPGTGDNVVISGHNNTQGSVFRELYKVEAGDTIALWQHHQLYLYKVDTVQILPEKGESLAVRAENATWINGTDAERLTLVSCWPEWSNSHRVVVTASPLQTVEMR